MTKTEKSINEIRRLAEKAVAPAVMLSFGKDSMVMAALIREAFPVGLNGSHFPRPHGFPLPVIYHRDPWFPVKHEFADQIARSWAMELHDFPPVAVGVKVNTEQLELVARYNFGTAGIDVPKNVCAPSEYPRRDYICGLRDWLMRPKALVPYPWDTIFIGHKSRDVDPFDGPIPLKHDVVKEAGITIAFPLRDWTDADVWDYIEDNYIKVQPTRYADRQEIADKWYNNDYTHACTACIDPRCKTETVFCPKLKRDVPNHGAGVLRLETRPDYIERKAA